MLLINNLSLLDLMRILILHHVQSMNGHAFSVEAMACGYHEWQDVYNAPIGETVRCEREVGIIFMTLLQLPLRVAKMLASLIECGSFLMHTLAEKTMRACNAPFRSGIEVAFELFKWKYLNIAIYTVSYTHSYIYMPHTLIISFSKEKILEKKV